MIKLYPHQEKATQHALSMLSERGNSLIVAGTGAGKTIMMAAVIGRYHTAFYAEHKRLPHILVLVHRTEIHHQNHDKFSLVCPGIATSQITATRKSLHGSVHFGMVATVSNLIPELEKSDSYFDLIVIDEAHHSAASTYLDIIEWNRRGKPDSALLGVTATPNRGDKLPLIDLFDNYYQITTDFLIKSHYLVRPTFIDLSPVFKLPDKLEKGRLNKNCKDDIEGRILLSELVDSFMQHKEPGKTIMFCPSHSFCERVIEALKEKGTESAYLAQGISDEDRKAELSRFEKGDVDVLVNVDICTEGYDFPELRNLVDFDTNGTHGQWVQKVGRVLRLSPGKTSCTVLDFGGNCELYPDGVECDVLLEGAQKKPHGEKLTDSDFYRGEIKQSDTSAQVLLCEDKRYSPYHLPKGIESINDKELGIVYVACGVERDCIVVCDDGEYKLFSTDKRTLKKEIRGDFDTVADEALRIVGNTQPEQRPISKLQIQLLAPDYPTAALDWYSANCCICWKTWRGEVINEH